MRVFYSFPLTLGAPGIGTTALEEVRGLVAAGLDVTVVCTTTRVPVPGARVVETLRLLGMRVPHRAFLRVQRAYAYHDLVASRLLRRRRHQVDVVHVWPRGCLRTAREARRLGIPSVREVPSPHTESAFEKARDAAAEFGLVLPSSHSHAWKDDVLAREREEYDAVDALLVPSVYARSTFLERGTDPRRLLVTQYGYDPTRFHPAGRPPSHAGLVAAFIGRGEPNKGLHLALRAWLDSGAQQDGTFHVCGRLWEPYAERIAGDLADDSVVVQGFVDAAQILRDADVLLLPTYTEGSALVVYEAMGSGCVPLVSTAAGAPVRHDENGLLHEVGDVPALAAQLRMLHADRAHLARLRAGALDAARELTWGAAAGKLVEAYRQVAELATQSPGTSRRALSA